jgi:hypothetical protein
LVAGQPTDADLRRAISTIYYALFHTIAHACADAVIPIVSGELSDEARRVAYRGLDHGTLRSACVNSNIVRRLPPKLAELADAIPLLQTKRHVADYSPTHDFALKDIVDDIDSCQALILDFLAAPEADRRAFVAFVLFRSR